MKIPLSGRKAADKDWLVITLSAVADSDRGALGAYIVVRSNKLRISHIGVLQSEIKRIED